MRYLELQIPQSLPIHQGSYNQRQAYLHLPHRCPPRCYHPQGQCHPTRLTFQQRTEQPDHLFRQGQDRTQGCYLDNQEYIPDYLDNIPESYLAPVGTSGQVVQSSAGTSIVLGDTALADGNNEVGIDEEDVGTPDADYNYLGGLVDFEVSGAPDTSKSTNPPR